MANADIPYAEPDADGNYTRWYVPSCPLAHECSPNVSQQHKPQPNTQQTQKHITQQHNTNNKHTHEVTMNNNKPKKYTIKNNTQHTQTITQPQSNTKHKQLQKHTTVLLQGLVGTEEVCELRQLGRMLCKVGPSHHSLEPAPDRRPDI
jgi:hypothetical protein